MTYQIAEPATEALTLVEVKNWLRVEHTADDSLIESLIKAARIWATDVAGGRCFVSQTVTEYWDSFDCCTIPFSVQPLASITSVSYIAKGTEAYTYTTWDSANYLADAMGGKLVKKDSVNYPETATLPNAVKIIYVAGSTTCPEDVKAAMFLWIAFHYENREDMPVNESKNPRIRSAAAILNRYRTWTI